MCLCSVEILAAFSNAQMHFCYVHAVRSLWYEYGSMHSYVQFFEALHFYMSCFFRGCEFFPIDSCLAPPVLAMARRRNFRRKEDLDEYLHLRRVLNARCHRGQSGALDLRDAIDQFTDPIVRYEWLKAKLIVQRQGGKILPSNEAFVPSRGNQIASLDLRELSCPCVVKSFKKDSVALKRTLAVYGHLRETNMEKWAPLPALVQIVHLQKKDNEKGTRRIKSNDTGRVFKKKGALGGKTLSTKRGSRGRSRYKILSRVGDGGSAELWFRYMGQDVAKKI